MNIDLSRLATQQAYAAVTEYRITEWTTITQVGAAVDALTGLPACPNPAVLRDRRPREIAEYLIHNLAGDTVFVVQTGGVAYVVRPAFSELEVYYHFDGDTLTLWSGTALPVDITSHSWSLNWEYLHGSMINSTWVTPQTGFIGVEELLSGAILDCRDGEVNQTDHLPDLFAATPRRTESSFDRTRDMCRELLLASVAHKTSGYEGKVGIAASGGLDSSVVAVATALCHPDSALPLINTYRDDDESSDEREYFAALARAIPGAQPHYIETSEGVSRTDTSADLFAPAPRPSKIAAAGPLNQRIHAKLAELGCTRLLSGDGGDQLFLRLSRATLAPELVGEAATRAARVRVLSALAAHQHKSIWTMARAARRPAEDTEHWRNMFGDLAFRAPSVLARPPREMALIPSTEKVSTWPLSVAFQYVALRNAEMNRIALADSTSTERKPALFWPLIRSSLTAPRTHHLHDGIDRAVERAMFTQLPSEIVHRIGKGGGRDLDTRYDYRRLAQGLLDSELCDRNLLDRQELTQLADGHTPDGDTRFALIRAAVTNEWIAHALATT
ncbi:asparagine synthase-related protein [Nocardia sp. CA-129566]|uniref:asparagine synthase-related protein n=1 Tax=Nocardia sp. CA-129566 TaxID=3239976 RepID=UPI003D9936E0